MHNGGCSRALGLMLWLWPLCLAVSSFAAEGSGEIRGVVQVNGKAVAGAQITLLDPKEAGARYENRMAAAKSNLVVLGEKAATLKSRREALERERTVKVYRGMFPEVGPAEKEELRKQAANLSAQLASVEAEEAAVQSVRNSTVEPGAFFEPAWTNALGSVRTSTDGSFTISAPVAGDCWLALPLRPGPSGKIARGWLIPLTGSSQGIFLCETNSIQVRP